MLSRTELWIPCPFQAWEPIKKSQMRIGKFTFCPKCNAMGKVKEIFFGIPCEDHDLDRYVLVGSCVEDYDPEIQCTVCEWLGVKEEVRFAKGKSSNDFL
jgi:hypothetical protein